MINQFFLIILYLLSAKFLYLNEIQIDDMCLIHITYYAFTIIVSGHSYSIIFTQEFIKSRNQHKKKVLRTRNTDDQCYSIWKLMNNKSIS